MAWFSTLLHFQQGSSFALETITQTREQRSESPTITLMNLWWSLCTLWQSLCTLYSRCELPLIFVVFFVVPRLLILLADFAKLCTGPSSLHRLYLAFQALQIITDQSISWLAALSLFSPPACSTRGLLLNMTIIINDFLKHWILQCFNCKTHDFRTFLHFSPHIWNNFPPRPCYSLFFKRKHNKFLFSPLSVCTVCVYACACAHPPCT